MSKYGFMDSNNILQLETMYNMRGIENPSAEDIARLVVGYTLLREVVEKIGADNPMYDAAYIVLALNTGIQYPKQPWRIIMGPR